MPQPETGLPNERDKFGPQIYEPSVLYKMLFPYNIIVSFPEHSCGTRCIPNKIVTGPLTMDSDRSCICPIRILHMYICEP